MEERVTTNIGEVLIEKIQEPVIVEAPIAPDAEEDPKELELLEKLSEAKKIGDEASVLSIESELSKLRRSVRRPARVPSPLAGLNGGPAPGGEGGIEWTGYDVLVAGTNYSEIRHSITSDDNGNLYLAVERLEDPYIRIYKSTNNGSSWFWWYWFCGGGSCQGPDITYPSITIGEGNQDWVLMAFKYDTHSIYVARINLIDLSWNWRLVENNPSGVAYPRITTDDDEFAFWYPYVAYNSKGVDNWVLQFSRSFNFGDNWTAPATLWSYRGFPDPLYVNGGYPDIDYGSGDLYIGYDDYWLPSETYRDVLVQRSTNYGASWAAFALTTSADDEYDAAVGAVKLNFTNRTAVVAYTRNWANSGDLDVWHAWTRNGGSPWFTNYGIATSSLDDEVAPDLVTSPSLGRIHAAYWRDYDIAYRSASFVTPFSWTGINTVNNLNSASSVYDRPSIVANPRMTATSEAGIGWTDFRTGDYDVFFDAIYLPEGAGCYDRNTTFWITPPALGDWNVFNDIVCNDTVITLNGNLNIFGRLEINNVNLRMNSAFMGQYGINVNTGGSFLINSRGGFPSVIEQGDNASNFYTFKIQTGSIFELRNSEVHNAGFAYNLPNFDQSGLWINTNRARIENSLITNGHFFGVYLYQSSNHTIRNNMFSSNDWTGILGTGSYNNIITGNTINSNGLNGISLSTTANNVIFNNTVSGNGLTGIAVSSGLNENITLNRVISNGYGGISLSSAPSSSIIRNNASFNGLSGISLSSSPSSVVSNNAANSNGDHGIAVSFSSIPITGNNASGNGDNGISLSSASFSTLSNNMANNNGDTGIALSSVGNYSVLSNKMSGNWRGMSLGSSSGNLVRSNNISSTVWYGLHLSNSPFNLMEGNSISNTAGEWDSAGTYASFSPSNTFRVNNYNNNYFGLVFWYSPSSNFSLNNVQNTAQTAVSFQSSGSATIVSNTVTNNGGGIALSSSGNSNILANKVTGNGAGISLASSDTSNILNNIANSNGVGISLSGTDYTNILNNNASLNTNGISLSGSTVNLINNNEVNNNLYGVSLSFSSSFNNVTINQIKSNAFGLSLSWYSNNNLVSSNDMRSNVNYGGHVFNSDSNTIQNNDIRNSQSIGIFMEGSDSNSLLNNDIKNSLNYGIDLLNSDSNVMNGNDVRLAEDVGVSLSNSHFNTIQNTQSSSSSQGFSIRWSNNNSMTSNNFLGNNYGISLLQSNGNTIQNNNATNGNNTGINLDVSNQNMISNNFVNNIGQYGIHLYSSTGNTISNNDVRQNSLGIFLDFSPVNMITQNLITDNSLTGLALFFESNSNTVTDNNVNDNDNISIRVSQSDNNIIHNNLASGSALGIFLDFASGNSIMNNIANNNDFIGINLEFSSNNNAVRNNSAINNGVGVSLQWSSYNTISDVETNNSNVGFNIQFSSSFNTIANNSIVNSLFTGISIAWSSNNNIVYNNFIKNNSNGITTDSTITGNLVYGNNFIVNSIQGFGNGTNLWNFALPEGGNYWSDYDHPAEGCFDSNPPFGICDGPYNITGGDKQDLYPHTASFLNSNAPPTITTSPVTVGRTGFPYSYDVDAFDPENDPITYSLPVAPAGMTIHSDTGLIDWLPALAGEYNVSVQATDTIGGPDIQSYTITVSDNYPPSITTTPTTTAEEGQLYQYDLDATDPNLDPLSYSLLLSPASMTIDPNTGLISWIAQGNFTLGPPSNSTAGNLTIISTSLIPVPVPVTAQVSDGFGGVALQYWNITVEVGQAQPCLPPGPC